MSEPRGAGGRGVRALGPGVDAGRPGGRASGFVASRPRRAVRSLWGLAAGDVRRSGARCPWSSRWDRVVSWSEMLAVLPTRPTAADAFGPSDRVPILVRRSADDRSARNRSRTGPTTRSVRVEAASALRSCPADGISRSRTGSSALGRSLARPRCRASGSRASCSSPRGWCGRPDASGPCWPGPGRACPAGLDAELETSRHELGIRRRVRIAVHPDIAAPMCVGLLRPVILWPTPGELPDDPASSGSRA